MQCQKLKTYMETGRVVFLPERSIRPNPAQPRRIFKPEALTELSDSIRQHGILQPLSVRRTDSGYELIAGERRLRAARMAGLTDIPCILMQMDDGESEIAAMVENLQRQDLDFVEEAMGISRLMSRWNLSQEQVARRIGKSQSAVANKLRILRHSDRVLQALLEAGLTERHARALLPIEDEEVKLSLIAQKLPVSRLEAKVALLSSPAPPQKRPAEVGSFLRSMNTALKRIRTGGIAAISEQRETESQIVVTITIPK